jgi:uncharacterized protein (TIGR03663 family)
VQAADFLGKIREHFSFERIFLLLFLISLIVRLYQLDLKLLHHDEAVHAWFSYRLLTEGTYQYNPVYHGPLLYHITAGMFWIFGDGDFIARLVPALLGALLVPLLYPIYRLGYLNSRQALIAALFFAISPNLVYFSRFLRNDIFIVFFSLLLLVSLLLYFEKEKSRYALLGAVAVAGGMCCKENMPIVLLTFAGYIVYLLWRGVIRLPDHWKRDFATGTVLVVAIMAIFYSSFGKHPEILIEGLIGAIEHWTAMHQQQRLGGPPYFYLMLFILYEVPIFALALIATAQFFLDKEPLPPEKAGDISQKGNRIHGFFNSLFYERKNSIILDKNREFTRFCIFWMISSIAVYAYIGEKVPWLILHQLLPMVFVAVYKMNDIKAFIAIGASIFLIAMTVHVAFVPADINEPIVQVQNSEDLRTVMALIDSSDGAAIATGNSWPLPWYYRGEKGSKISYLATTHDASYFESQDFDVIVTHDMESFPSIEGYEKVTYIHSYWFSAYNIKGRWLDYYLTRKGTPGSLNWDVFIRSRD